MQKLLKQLNCKYGAPMGRYPEGKKPVNTTKVHVFKIQLDSGGYDNGGAYWGHDKQAVYCATDGDQYFNYVRADYRGHAILLLANDLIEANVIGGFKFYDNGGKSADRYTACWPLEKVRINGTYPRGVTYPYIAMSENPFHPMGVGMHGDSAYLPSRSLGKKISFAELPMDCQTLVMHDIN